MKKFLIVLAIIIITIIIIGNILNEINNNPKGPFIEEITTADEFTKYGYNEKDYRYFLKNDIEIFPKNPGFTDFGQNIIDSVFDGEGHTITVKGDDGSIGKERSGIFRNITNSTIKNLTIVFQFALKVETKFGGLAATIENCTIENVHIVYKKGVEYVGSADYSFGGMIAEVNGSSKIVGCSVKGAIKSRNYCVGGLVGSLGSLSCVLNSKFEGGINMSMPTVKTTSDRTARGFCGGLAGANYGTIISSMVRIDKLNISFNAATFDINGHCEVGSLVGYCYGFIKDCYVDFAEDASFCSNKASTFFSRDLCSGLLCGHLSGGAHLDNVYIDVSNWKELDDKTVGSNYQLGALFGFTESNNINNVIFVDTSSNIVLKQDIYSNIVKTLEEIYIGKEFGEKLIVGTRFEYKTKINIDDYKLTLTLRYVISEEDNYYEIESSDITIGEDTIKLVPTAVEGSKKHFKYLFSNDDYHLWEINAVFDFDNMGVDLDIIRSIKSSNDKFILNFDNVKIIDNYFDIIIDEHSDIIGQTPSLWIRNDDGKPILNTK